MLCLKCENVMQKTIFEGVLIDYCAECKSFWLDKEEFEKAVQNDEFDSASLVAEARHEALLEIRKKEEGTGINVCPKCLEGKMYKFEMFGVDLDKCDLCEGVFFDKGELEECYERATEGFFLRMLRHIKEVF